MSLMNPISIPATRLGRIAILWRGDETARRNATAETSRFKSVFAALSKIGVDAEPIVYEDDVLDAVREPRPLPGVRLFVPAAAQCGRRAGGRYRPAGA